jgi:GT2 family glycosyltransferase
LRLKQAGWQVWYWPQATVLHLKGVSSRQQSFRMLIEFHRAMAQFFGKHYAAQTAAPLRWAIHAAIWARCGALLVANSLRSDRRVSR